MQRGLVHDRAMDDSCAVALLGETQSVEPGGPSRVEVPLEADFVLSGLGTSVRRCVCVIHVLLPSFLPSFARSQARKRLGEAASPNVVIDGVI